MRIIRLEPEFIHEIHYQTVAIGGGTVHSILPMLAGTADQLPEGLEAIAFASDLQGVTRSEEGTQSPNALGITVAESLARLAGSGRLPPTDRIGVVLAGDFHISPYLERRGGSGDVRDIWEAFRAPFRWVAGVPGNHDLFGDSPADFEEFTHRPNLYFLDGTCVDIGSLRICGIGGVLGKRPKPFRRRQVEFLRTLTALCSQRPDIVILHEAPLGHPETHPGSQAIRGALEGFPPCLIVCGHQSWETPLVEMANGGQVLGVGGLAFVLLAG